MAVAMEENDDEDEGDEDVPKRIHLKKGPAPPKPHEEGRAAPVLARCCGGPQQEVLGGFEGVPDDSATVSASQT